MEKTAWKTIAIISTIILILESVFIFYIFDTGYEAIENENECAYNVCEYYDSYFYDSVSQICECYTDNILQIERYIK